MSLANDKREMMGTCSGLNRKSSLFLLRGQTATEYVLILALVTIMIIGGLAFIGDDMKVFLSKVNSNLAEVMD